MFSSLKKKSLRASFYIPMRVNLATNTLCVCVCVRACERAYVRVRAFVRTRAPVCNHGHAHVDMCVTAELFTSAKRSLFNEKLTQFCKAGELIKI